MKHTPFFRLGTFIYRYKMAIISIWLLVVLGCMPFLPSIITPFQSTGFVSETSESAKIDHLVDQQLGRFENKIIITFHHSKLKATNKSFQSKIEKALSGLQHLPIEHTIILPSMNKDQISKDKHTAYAVVIFKQQTPITSEQLEQIKLFIKNPADLQMLYGGEPVFIQNLNTQTQHDLSQADLIAAPVSIITLILVFGSVVAATIPVILGGSCAIIILTCLYGFAHACTLSIFTLNIALLLGLCLSLDYSLFIINRFKEELDQNQPLINVLEKTLATAGKSVFFSGLAVFISLSALLIFPVNILFSVGIGGLTAVFIAVFIAVVVLPAVLCLVNKNINRLPVRLFKPQKRHLNSSPSWRWIALNVVKRPILFCISALLVLLLLGAPFLKANIGVSDFRLLPEHSESRVFFKLYEKEFNINTLTPIRLVVMADNGNILSSSNISKLYDLTRQLEKNPLIDSVNSIVNVDPSMKKRQYQLLYASEQKNNIPFIKALLKTTSTKELTTINVVSRYKEDTPETRELINELRHVNPGSGLSMKLTGIYVNNEDVLSSIADIFPYALIWVISLTYLILLILLRSLFLPLKAILMTILSLCASYGILVLVFQEGHLSHLLNFEPQGLIDISLMVIIFCALFGFSMDYEVFLLSRIQESYIKYRNNKQSIVFGIEHSSRIITSAALIVIVICASFMVAEVIMVKEFGLGIAVAIAVDAFLVRSVLVPSVMTLMNQWNWYLPAWLEKRLPRF